MLDVSVVFWPNLAQNRHAKQKLDTSFSIEKLWFPNYITISILCSRLYFFRSSSIQHPAAKEQSILHGLQCRKGYMLIFQTCVDCFFFLMQCYMNHNLDFKFNAVQNSMKQKPSNGTFWYVRRAVTQAERNESVSLSQNYKTMCGLLMLPC